MSTSFNTAPCTHAHTLVKRCTQAAPEEGHLLHRPVSSCPREHGLRCAYALVHIGVRVSMQFHLISCTSKDACAHTHKQTRTHTCTHTYICTQTTMGALAQAHLDECVDLHLRQAGQHDALQQLRSVRAPHRPQRARQHARALQRLWTRHAALQAWAY